MVELVETRSSAVEISAPLNLVSTSLDHRFRATLSGMSNPPGWYFGGVAGEERWWSGEAWTEHVRPTAGGVAIAQPMPMRQGPKPPRVFYGTYVGSIVGACFAFVVAFGIFCVAPFLFFSSPIHGVGAFVMGLAAVALGLTGLYNARGLKRQEAQRAAANGQPPQSIS